MQLTLGMNAFVTAEGFTKISMVSVAIGATLNIVLDPIMIFGLNMGVRGAALATVISQAVSCIVVVTFLCSEKSILRLKRKNLNIKPKVVFPCIALGTAAFIMQASESVISVCFNSSLLKYGGDIAVGAMTILTSVMQFAMLPLQGIAQGAQPIMSFNYGAKKMDRVKKAYRLLMVCSFTYTMIFCLAVEIAPGFFVHLFNSSSQELFEMTSKAMPLPVENDTCVHNRSVGNLLPPEGASFDELMDWYAGEILGQIPCMRMMDPTGRKKLYNDPSVAGIIYHTVKFCDFYSFEYAEIKNHTDVPLLKIESDYTIQSSGQLLTRLEAFAESIQPETLEQTIDGDTKGERKMGKGYFAGIDSGSTSTDVVILNKDHEIVTSIILPTGAGAAIGADRALAEALKEAGLQREDIDALVTTGYGRTAIKNGDKSITEITCHARGAHFLNPEVRTVIDIGGQDSKVIRLDENGAVANFVMNDKCAAGTGRFLEMMARTMEMNLDQMSECGLEFKEDITISSMCTVFAESEVVSLIAQNKATDDIVHGLNKAVAVKTAALTRRVGGEEKYMMTGGVSKNKGLVKTLEEKLGTKLVISDKAQLCGALGAALFAADMADV